MKRAQLQPELSAARHAAYRHAAVAESRSKHTPPARPLRTTGLSKPNASGDTGEDGDFSRPNGFD